MCGDLEDRGGRADKVGLRPADALRPGGLTVNADVANFKVGLIDDNNNDKKLSIQNASIFYVHIYLSSEITGDFL